MNNSANNSETNGTRDGAPQKPAGYPPYANPDDVTVPLNGTPLPGPGNSGPAVYTAAPPAVECLTQNTNPDAVSVQPTGKIYTAYSAPDGLGDSASLQWMSPPQAPVGCPPGLEYLVPLDKILSNQAEAYAIGSGNIKANRYQLKNSLEHQVFFAHEEIRSVCTARCCDSKRGFLIHIVDKLQQDVIIVKRPFKCCAGCCWCAGCDALAYTVNVTAATGQVLGYIKQRFSAFAPHFDIFDANEQHILKIRGPACLWPDVLCPGDLDFRLKTADDAQEVGNIRKEWGGYATPDNFIITFPKEFDVKVKATLLGAFLLIDYMFFNLNPNPYPD